MITLLEKDQIEKSNLIFELEMSQEAEISVKKLSRKLGCSDYIIKRMIDDLNGDFYKAGYEARIETRRGTKEIRLYNEGRQQLHTMLMGYYYGKSCGVDILLKIFKGEMDSVRKYANKEYISHSVVYRWIQTVSEFLSGHDIELLKEDGKYCAKGDFRKRRFIETEICYRSNRSPKEYFGKRIYEIIHKILYRINAYTGQFPPSVSKKVLFLLGIIIRDTGGKNSDSLNHQFLFERINGIGAYEALAVILKDLGMTEDRVKLEINEIYAFLLYTGVIDKQDQEHLLNHSEYRRMTKQMISIFWREASQQLGVAEFQEMVSGLDWIHFSATYREMATVMRGNVEQHFFVKNHPDILEYCLKKVKKLKEVNCELYKKREYLIGQYALVLDKYGYLAKRKERVRIAVDFSYGRQFNNYVKNRIEKIASPFQLRVSNHLSYDTDILLTDEFVITRSGIEIIHIPMYSKQFDWNMLQKRLTESIEKSVGNHFLAIFEE